MACTRSQQNAQVLWSACRRSRQAQLQSVKTPHNCAQSGILNAIPPVASTAGEGGQPPGGGHLRVALFAFNQVSLPG